MEDTTPALDQESIRALVQENIRLNQSLDEMRRSLQALKQQIISLTGTLKQAESTAPEGYARHPMIVAFLEREGSENLGNPFSQAGTQEQSQLELPEDPIKALRDENAHLKSKIDMAQTKMGAFRSQVALLERALRAVTGGTGQAQNSQRLWSTGAAAGSYDSQNAAAAAGAADQSTPEVGGSQASQAAAAGSQSAF